MVKNLMYNHFIHVSWLVHIQLNKGTFDRKSRGLARALFYFRVFLFPTTRKVPQKLYSCCAPQRLSILHVKDRIDRHRRARARRLDVGARVRIIAQPHYTHLEDPAFARPLKAIRRLGARLFTVTVA